MVCIFCSNETSVVNSRSKRNVPSTWRRRRCDKCRAIFSTREKPDYSLSIKIQKRSGDLEPFSEDKLFLSIKDSLSHRNDPHSSSRQLTETIIRRLLPCSSGVLKHEEVAGVAYKIIRRFDRAAATYYKSHHRLENRN